MTTLAEDLVPDKLWEMVVPLLPAAPRPWYGGRRRTVPDHSCFAAIVYMTRTSTPWRLLPVQELGCGSPADGMAPVERVGQGWGIRAAPRKPGSKIHLACEGSGLPLTAVVTAANSSDVTMLAVVLDDVPAVLTPAGWRRSRPGKLDADKGGGAGAVVAELLSAAAGAVGSRLGTVLCVRAVGVCPGLLQADLAASKWEPASYLVPVTQTAWFSSRTWPSAVVYGAHASVTLAQTRCWTSGGRPSTSELIGGATSRSHRVASSGESVW